MRKSILNNLKKPRRKTERKETARKILGAIIKFEFKKTMFSNKQWYFIDVKSVSEVTSSGFDIEYNDGDIERISTFGIRPSHKKAFRDAVYHYVCKSLVVERADD